MSFDIEGDSPSTRPGYGLDKLETHDDFVIARPDLQELSLEMRPGAVSLTYKQAYTYGPVMLGDSSQGEISHVWRVRADNLNIYLARENDSGWDAETLLVSIPAFAIDNPAYIREIDVAFDQAGRVVVCMERGTGGAGAGQLWLYYYDSLANAYVISNFGGGRNARAIMDVPDNASDSDVLIFYISPNTNQLHYRQQRDRYSIQYDTPFTDAQYCFVEDAIKTQDNRVQIVLSKVDPVTEKYSLIYIETTLYPFSMQAEILRFTSSMVSSELYDILKSYDSEVEFIRNRCDLFSVALTLVDLNFMLPPELIRNIASLTSGSLADVVVEKIITPELIRNTVTGVTLTSTPVIEQIIPPELLRHTVTMGSVFYT